MLNGRKVLAEVQSGPVSTQPFSAVTVTDDDENITVEQYLERQFEEIVKDLHDNNAVLIQKLRIQFDEGAKSLKSLMEMSLKSTIDTNKIIIQLKCIAGQHMGLKYRLEATGNEEEDVFKIGRSTGKQFKEKGISLYKDKEVSTTHAKIEIKNGVTFFVDLRSTNGSQMNGDDCEALMPYRLNESDIITVGSTELRVHFLDPENIENQC